VGPTDLILVASRKPLDFDARKVAERLALPDVREDLGRTDIHDVFGLLAKQVHSEQGQIEFAGTGPINTDDHNLLEYAAPVAFFLQNQDTSVHDERRGPDGGTRLWIHRYLRENPPSAEQAAHLYRNLDHNHAINDPLLRGAAALWYSLAPDSLEARVALANTAMAQKDLTLAESVLAPVQERGSKDPSFVSAWMKLVAARAWASRTAWTPASGLTEAAALGRQQRVEHPADQELAKALKALCEASPQACEPSHPGSTSPSVATPGAQ
jgi:hypothetical protein